MSSSTPGPLRRAFHSPDSRLYRIVHGVVRLLIALSVMIFAVDLTLGPRDPGSELVQTTRLGFSLLSHAVAMPGSAVIMSRVASAGAQSVFLGQLPPGEHEKKPSTFGEPALHIKQEYDALLIGVRRQGARRQELNLPDDESIEPTGTLIYLAPKPVLPEVER